jgi:hypothetical protein
MDMAQTKIKIVETVWDGELVAHYESCPSSTGFTMGNIGKAEVIFIRSVCRCGRYDVGIPVDSEDLRLIARAIREIFKANPSLREGFGIEE